MTSISDGTTTVVPILIDGYEGHRQVRNIRHAILGSDIPSYSLRTSSTRSGPMKALFATNAEAVQLDGLLKAAALFTLTDADHPSINMTFAIKEGSETSVTLDEETRDLWWVEFEFDEVT